MKVARNKGRDKKTNAECEAAGWRVVRIWEHDIKDDAAQAAGKIKHAVSAGFARRRVG